MYAPLIEALEVTRVPEAFWVKLPIVKYCSPPEAIMVSWYVDQELEDKTLPVGLVLLGVTASAPNPLAFKLGQQNLGRIREHLWHIDN